MSKNLEMYLGEARLRKIAHRCQKIINAEEVKADYEWRLPHCGGGAKTWRQFAENFLAKYHERYYSGYHQLIAVATLLACSRPVGIYDRLRGEHQFRCNLNKPLYTLKPDLSGYSIPVVQIEDEAVIHAALRAPAHKRRFDLRVKVCDPEDRDPRTAKDTQIEHVYFSIPSALLKEISQRPSGGQSASGKAKHPGKKPSKRKAANSGKS